MKLVVTIDTEEDNWGVYSPTGQTLGNIERIPLLQDLFDEFDVKPTYLITYPVATDERSVSILRPILNSGRCEIGAHCHPWNTPPVEESMSAKNSMLCNLSLDLQYKKIHSLDHAIRQYFGVKPISFRAGRWGYSQSVALNLFRLGYKIDTSITPYTNWVNEHGPSFADMSPAAYKFAIDNIFRDASLGQLLEVPATIGYLQKDFARCARILKVFSAKPMRYLKAVGILSRLRIIQKVWLSPENSDARGMVGLARRMKRNDYSVINMFFHSPSLKAGLTPFVKSRSDEAIFLSRIREFLSYVKGAGVETATLSDCLSERLCIS